ncbi:glycosyltransferase family 2 protein, partial [Thermodesulfobacteriota bacterium]
VCTHNRADCLQRCIDSLIGQSLETERFEILVVDNGSTDNTKQICEGYADIASLRYIHEPVLGLSQARNRGLLEARGDYIGYIDDDAAAEPAWLTRALESFALDPAPDWVGGSVTLVWEAERPSWLTEYYFGALGWVDWGAEPRFLDPKTEWLVGCNSLFRRQTLEKLGGFDTRLGRKKKLLLSGEEVQLHHRIQSMNGAFYYHPEIHVRHLVARVRTTPAYFYRRYYWGGITDYIMARTLQGMPSQMTSATEETNSRLGRLLSHSLKSTGIDTPQDKTIQSRIYMSYVVGQVVALLKYGWRKLDL